MSRVSGLCLCLMLGFLSIFRPAVAADEQLAYADKSKLRKLLYDFQRAADDPAKRSRLAAEMLAIGDGTSAAEEILKRIDRDLDSPLRRYAKDLSRAAKDAVDEQMEGSRRTDRSKLQRSIRELQELEKKLTRADIKRVAEPAMDKLRKLYLVDAADIIAASPEHGKQRQAILQLGADWGPCRAKLGRSGTDFKEWLQLFEYLVVSRAGLPSGEARKMQRNEEELLTIDPAEATAIRDLNVMRVLADLKPLELNLKLCESARGHSQDMERLKFFSHSSRVKGKKTMTDRGKLVGTAVHGENIFMGRKDPFAANRAWFFSPGHHVNMFREGFSEIGVGRSGKYWTQNFKR